GSATPTITPTVTGSAFASGQVTRTDTGNWTETRSSGSAGVWTYPSGSGATTNSVTNDGNYSASGSFTASGAVSGSGTINESGNGHTGDSWVTNYGVASSTGDWVPSGGTGNGSESGSTFWSYSGNGTYTDSAAGDGVKFVIPGSASI